MAKTITETFSTKYGKSRNDIGGGEVENELGEPHSIPIDWRNLKIDGQTIPMNFDVSPSHKSCVKEISVRKDEILHVEAEFRRHLFTIDDFVHLRFDNFWYVITGNLLVLSLICVFFRVTFEKKREHLCFSDILFLIVFFLLLSIPAIATSDAVQSIRELRRLAVKPTLKTIFVEKSNYGKQYEDWFKDHFGGRISLIKLHDVIRNKLSRVIRTNRAVYFKENGYDFVVPFISNWDCRAPFLQSIVQNLVQLNQFCQQNQIKLYILEVPRKESVYKEFLSRKYGFDERAFVELSQAQKTIRDEMKKHHIPYIYPYEVLQDAAKQDFVFFKLSHHWTDWGAFIGYRELMREVNKDFPDMPLVSLNDYRRSQNRLQRDDYSRDYGRPIHLSQFFNFSSSELNSPADQVLYNYMDHKNGDKMKVKVLKFTKDFTYPNGKYKVMLIGTSQNENLLQFLPYSTAYTKYIRLNKKQVKTADEFKVMKLYKKDILAFKPDILILSIHTDNLPRLRDLCSPK